MLQFKVKEDEDVNVGRYSIQVNDAYLESLPKQSLTYTILEEEKKTSLLEREESRDSIKSVSFEQFRLKRAKRWLTCNMLC